LYSGATIPVNATTESANIKTGKACSFSVLSLVSGGDGSIAEAKKDGGITSVSTIDYSVNNVLGFYGRYCTIVTGK